MTIRVHSRIGHHGLPRGYRSQRLLVAAGCVIVSACSGDRPEAIATLRGAEGPAVPVSAARTSMTISATPSPHAPQGDARGRVLAKEPPQS